ncbi:hypothetical protein HYW87_02320 [Candidatus Roizmanbacteria bacterium]|nr:hypothetical protein [Candidatus Roizmanbacteria bacterium]
MKYLEMQRKLKLNLFTLLDVQKLFPEESDHAIKVQLSRFGQKGLMTQIKRGLYCFDQSQVDEFELANKLYQPSYISMETALNYYGLIPDITQSLTSVTLTTTKKIENQFGTFHYVKISRELFFGFQKVRSAKSQSYFNIAVKEKSLLDYLYIRRLKSVKELRLNTSPINFTIFRNYAQHFPAWVRKIKLT